MLSASSSQKMVVDITSESEYESYLCRCLGGPPSKHYRKRMEYLEQAIPKGFHKKLLVFNGEVVGTIEYAPSNVSYYPIIGDNLVVMNCIWVHRKAKGHNFGKRLIEEMLQSEKQATGFATIGLENYWMIWMQKIQMESLGFKSIKIIKLKHKTYHTDKYFKLHLMWLPKKKSCITRME